MHKGRTILALAVALVAAAAAGIFAAETQGFEQTVNGTLSTEGALTKQAADLKASFQQNAAVDKAAAQQEADAFKALEKANEPLEENLSYVEDDATVDEAAVHGGHPGGGHPGGNPGGSRPAPRPSPPRPAPPRPSPPRPTPRPAPHPVPHPGPHPGPRPHPAPHGPGHWNDRWHGHPGWGAHGRWGWRDGRYIWWGWVGWHAGLGLCNVYYADRYHQCSDAAWADNAICKSDCDRVGGGAECYYQCDSETRNAVNSCEFSYRGYWNCGGPVLWPPTGIVIRIP